MSRNHVWRGRAKGGDGQEVEGLLGQWRGRGLYTAGSTIRTSLECVFRADSSCCWSRCAPSFCSSSDFSSSSLLSLTVNSWRPAASIRAFRASFSHLSFDTCCWCLQHLHPPFPLRQTYVKLHLRRKQTNRWSLTLVAAAFGDENHASDDRHKTTFSAAQIWLLSTTYLF